MRSYCPSFAFGTHGICSPSVLSLLLRPMAPAVHVFWAYLGRLVEPNPKLFLHSSERGCGWRGGGV